MNNSSLFECTIPPRNENTERTISIIFKFFKILFIICAVATGIYAFYFSNFMWIITFIFVLLAILASVFQGKFFNYYDYSFCEDEIRLTRVVNNKWRRYITSFKIKDIEKLGFVSSNNYQKLTTNKAYKKIYAKSKLLEVNNLYFAVNSNNEKKIIIMAFNKRFLTGVFQRLSSKVYDDEFTNQIKEYEKYNIS